MADVKVGDKVRLSRTAEGKVIGIDSNGIALDGQGWFTTSNGYYDVEVLEHKPQVGDVVENEELQGLPIGAVVRLRGYPGSEIVRSAQGWYYPEDGHTVPLKSNWSPREIKYLPES